MKWTKEQQEAIEIRQKNILVSAAAGSGKTAVLVERIKQLILRDRIPLDRMLIVTFSNAAASEMREKIVEAISRELEERNSSFLRAQLNLIHRANISTFHAFAMEVIRRYFYLIDIEPNFKICDESQKTILQAEAMEQLFSSQFESGLQDFVDFLSKFAATKNDNAVKEMIYEVHSFIQSIPNSFQWLRSRAEELCHSLEPFEDSHAFREIREEAAQSLADAGSCFNRVGELLEEHGLSSLISKWKLDMETLDELKHGLASLSYDGFGRLAAGIKFQTFTASKEDKEAYEEIKGAVTTLRDQGKERIKKLRNRYFARPLQSYMEDIARTGGDAQYLCFLTEEFDRLYKEKKRSKGLIDFSDIEHYALAVLSHEEAAAEYRNKFEYIFIDEYQDSNIVQETLIGKIKRKNNLFMVGDVKQSIYKFRLAEPEIFISKYEAYKQNQSEYDIKLDLNRNFRSKGRIITAVNDIFSQIMNRELSGLAYDEAAALYPGRPYDGELDYPVELQIVDDRRIDDLSVDDEIKEMKRAEIEAYTAARIISELKGKLIFDTKMGEERPIANKDIVILLRSAKGYAEIYYDALMKEGIPAFVDAGDGYFDTMEVEVFLNLLRVIDNRKQDIPLLSVLRSPIFGLTMEDLIRIRISCREGTYFQALKEYADCGEDQPLKEKSGDILEWITAWKREAALMTLQDFLWMLIRQTGYFEYIGGLPGGSQRQANVRALVDKAVQFQSSQMKGLFSFINYIEAIRKRNVPMGQVKLLSENDDVVRIMTIHKSKGLEFPAVLVGGLGKRFNQDSDTYRISLHKDIGMGIRYVDKENSCYRKTIIQTVIDQKKKKESLAEELRILYVAFTRAMDKLILLGTMKDADAAMETYSIRRGDFSGARSYLDFIIPAMEKSSIVFVQTNRKDMSVRKEKAEHRKSLIRNIILGEAAFYPVAEELNREIGRRLSYEYGHKDALKLKSKFTVTEMSRLAQGEDLEIDGVPPLETPKFIREKSSFTGAQRGTILHKAMEHLDFQTLAFALEEASGEAGKMQIVGAAIDGLVERKHLTEEEAGAVSRRSILGFFDSDIGKRAAKSKNLYKEVSFNMMKELSGESIIIQGTIDCYFEENGKYILLDYKSNYLQDPENQQEVQLLSEGYKTQLNLYREALEKIRGIQVEEAYLYLFRAEKSVRIDLTGSL